MQWNPDRVLVYRKAPQPGAVRRSAPKATVRARRRVRVGIWDLDSCAGALPRLLDAVEEVQD